MPLSEEQDKDYREIFDAYQKDKEGNDIGESAANGTIMHPLLAGDRQQHHHQSAA